MVARLVLMVPELALIVICPSSTAKLARPAIHITNPAEAATHQSMAAHPARMAPEQAFNALFAICPPIKMDSLAGTFFQSPAKPAMALSVMKMPLFGTPTRTAKIPEDMDNRMKLPLPDWE